MNRGWKRIRPYRRTIQILSLLLLVAIPILNGIGWNHITGGYQSLGFFNLWIVSPVEGIESLLTSRSLYLPLVIALLPPIVLALLLGRVFCSWMCPMGLLSEWADGLRWKLRRRWRRRGPESHLLPKRVIWFVLAGDVLLSLIVGTSLFSAYSPPGIIGRELARTIFLGTLGGEVVLIVLILAFEVLVVRRGFCRYLCPLGAALSLFGRKRVLRVRLEPERCRAGCNLCQLGMICSWGLLPRAGEVDSAYCTNCGDCVDLCPSGALHFVLGRDSEGSATTRGSRQDEQAYRAERAVH